MNDNNSKENSTAVNEGAFDNSISLIDHLHSGSPSHSDISAELKCLRSPISCDTRHHRISTPEEQSPVQSCSSPTYTDDFFPVFPSEELVDSPLLSASGAQHSEQRILQVDVSNAEEPILLDQSSLASSVLNCSLFADTTCLLSTAPSDKEFRTIASPRTPHFYTSPSASSTIFVSQKIKEEERWNLAVDVNGRIYYYNTKLGESSWQAPEGSLVTFSTIFQASLEASVETMKEIADSVDITGFIDSGGRSVLHYSCASGSLDFVKFIVEQSTSGLSDEFLNLTDSTGMTALSCSCKYGFTEILKFLLEIGASIFIADVNQSSCLHEAAEHGQFDCVKILVEFTGDEGEELIWSRNSNGETSADVSMRKGYDKISSYLLSRMQLILQSKQSSEVAARNENDGFIFGFLKPMFNRFAAKFS